MRLPPSREMRSDSPALHAEQFRVPNQQVRSLDLLDGTPESPQEHCHKSTRTLMSSQECKIAQCTPNQLKMKINSPELPPEPSHVSHHTRQLALLPLGKFRDSLSTRLKSSGTPISEQQLEKSSVHPISSQDEN